MRTICKYFAVGAALSAAAFSTHAADNFVGLTWGETSNNIQSSSSLKRNHPNARLDHVIRNEGTWNVRAGQESDQGRYYLSYQNVSGSHNVYKLRQQNLMASYDVFLPIADQTKLFGGASLGLTKLEQESRGYRRDSDLGYAGGLQLGILQQLADNVSLEGGYRYLRSNAKTKLAPRGMRKDGSLRLHSSEQFYLGVNYSF